MLNRVKFPQQNKEGVIAFIFVKPPSEDLFFVVKQQRTNNNSSIVIEAPSALFDWNDSADFVEALMVARNLAMTKDMNNRFQFHVSLEDAIRGGYFMNPSYQVYYDYVDSNNMIYYYKIKIDYENMGNQYGAPISPAAHFPQNNAHSYPSALPYNVQGVPQTYTGNPNINTGFSPSNPQYASPSIPQIRQIPIVAQDVFTMQQEKLLVDITLPVVLRTA